MSKRYMILGATGMAGHVIALHLIEKGNDVVGFVRNKTDLFESITGDAHDLSLLESTIKRNRFDVIVNAIGVLNQAAENNIPEAIFLNAFLPHYLAKVTADMKTRVFHLSTDCVFSGNTGPYTEASIPDGMTFYDRTKALGELADKKNVTLRNSIIGPDLKPSGIGLLNWFMKQDGEVQGYCGAIWTGLTTLELAKAIESIARTDFSGLVNMVPDVPISKFELLNLFNTYLRRNKVIVCPSDSVQLDKALVRTNFETDYRPMSYEEQIRDLSIWMKERKSLYPHYDL